MSGRFKVILMAVLMGGLVLASAALAQEGVPSFGTLRFEEDWSQYPDEGIDSIFDPIKKVELTDNVWLSVGGQLRTRLEYWSAVGFNDANSDEFLLGRAFVHADLHLGSHWRVFVEGKFTTMLEDRDLPGGTRAVLDADEGDFWNTFIEAKYDVGSVNLTARFGRQELLYGAQRLVSPLDWSNNRRIFDGGLIRLKGSSWTLDAFATRPVIIEITQLNELDEDVWFSGLYFAKKMADGKWGFDAYFLAFNRDVDPVGDEDRYTVGGRVYGNVTDRLKLEAEAAYQFGNLDGADISAWMLTVEGTYSLPNISCKPFFTLGVDYASGDDDPGDGDVETFKHMFPLGHAYLGYIDVVGRQNIIDVRGTIGAWPIPKKLRTKADLHFFWLADEDDALYHAGGGVMRPAFLVDDLGNVTAVNENEVGAELDLTILYKWNRHTTILIGYSHFFTGDFIEESGSDDDIDFFYTHIDFKF